MEHQIYRVVRRSKPGTVQLTLEDHPSIVVAARSLAKAEEELLDKISVRFGDGEPVLDYLEGSETASSSIRWVFRSNEKVVTKNLSELFSEGICERCGVGKGERRKDVARHVTGKLKGDVAFTFSGPVLTHILSSSMADALLDTGLKRTDFAPVTDEGGGVYFEVLANKARCEWLPVKPHLGIRVGAQQCPRCGFFSFGFVHVEDKNIRRFIAAEDEQGFGDVTCIVGFNEPEPVLSAKAHSMIRKRKELRGFVWGRVGLLAPSDVETKLKFDPFPKP